MQPKDFELYRDLLIKNSGLVVTPDKSYLLDSRLTPVARKWGFASLADMTAKLRTAPDRNMVTDVVEAMTTNETLFFRDMKPFDLFREVVIPHMLEHRARTRSFNIWCAASSTGQEPYSLAMIIKEAEASLRGWSVNIMATDIDKSILKTAEEATYSQFEVQRGLPVHYLIKYFTQVGEKWQLKPEIRGMVRFAHFNLLDDMVRLGTFDVIFCRNVLIYFNDQTKTSVLDGMARRLVPDGFLFLGGAETVLGITESFVPVPDRRGMYILKDNPMAGPKTGSAFGLRPPVQATTAQGS